MANLVYGNALNNMYTEVEITPEKISVNYISANPDPKHAYDADFETKILFTVNVIE